MNPETRDAGLRAIAEFCGLDAPMEEIAALPMSALGIDSLELVSLAIHLEEQCGLRIDLDQASGITPLAELVQRAHPVGT